MEDSCVVRSELFQSEDYLRTLAWRYVKNHSDANDLIQETTCKVLEKTKYFRTGSNFKAWVSIVMRNTFINSYHKKKKHSVVPIEDNYFNLGSHTIEPIAEYKLFKGEINEAIERLDFKNQQVINLCLKGLSYNQISETLNLPLGTVKSRIHHGRKALKAELKKMNIAS